MATTLSQYDNERVVVHMDDPDSADAATAAYVAGLDPYRPGYNTPAVYPTADTDEDADTRATVTKAAGAALADMLGQDFS